MLFEAWAVPLRSFNSRLRDILRLRASGGMEIKALICFEMRLGESFHQRPGGSDGRPHLDLLSFMSR